MSEYELFLGTEFHSDDLQEKTTVKEYLKKLLFTLWEEKENFSGKRPFGNSDWECDLYKPLISTGLIEGSIDEYGCIEKIDEKEAHKFIRTCIKLL